MTITYPRTLPDASFSECTFDLNEGTVSARHAKGRASIVTQLNSPMWTAKFTTSEMDFARRETWKAWKSSLRGGVELFLAWDTSMPEPLAYPFGHPATLAATWDGTATVTALTATTVALAGLPAGYVATAGDRLGLVQSGRYGYFQILETVTMNGSGAGTVTVSPNVNPATSAIFTTAATAVLRRPLCLFQIDAETWSMPVDAILAQASFQATQVL